MTTRRLASTTAAASLAAVALLGMSAPTAAQEAPYPPAPTGDSSISDSTVVAGQAVTAVSGDGTFAAGGPVDVAVACLGLDETVTADADGSASFTFTPASGADPGRCEVVFSAGGSTVTVPFTIVAAAAADPGRGQRSDAGAVLPLTGTDAVVPLTVAGVVLVGVGAGIVLSARRRREDLPAGLA